MRNQSLYYPTDDSYEPGGFTVITVGEENTVGFVWGV